jgi:glucosamine--fructose-6-phosphate aminotransferase (isomerizing)
MSTAMLLETREAPDAVARLLDRELASIRALGAHLAKLAPPVVVTCARGSSDHAAHYLKYLLEIGAGIPVASMGPSIASVYGTALRLAGGVLVTVSQSGRSPDLVALQAAARRAGALTIAIVNAEDGPVAREADIVLPLHAGPEISVAATKSFVSSAVAVAAIVAAWTSDETLMGAIQALPETLRGALAMDWSAAIGPVAAASSCYVVGRGPALPVAQEAALKIKETAARHAEAFSLAEVMHGPLRLIEHSFPVIAFLPEDAAADENRRALARLAAAGGTVFAAGTAPAPTAAPGMALAVARTGEAMLDPISMILSFYVFAEQFSRHLGHDPDRPANLRKVTETM